MIDCCAARDSNFKQLIGRHHWQRQRSLAASLPVASDVYGERAAQGRPGDAAGADSDEEASMPFASARSSASQSQSQSESGGGFLSARSTASSTSMVSASGFQSARSTATDLSAGSGGYGSARSLASHSSAGSNGSGKEASVFQMTVKTGLSQTAVTLQMDELSFVYLPACFARFSRFTLAMKPQQSEAGMAVWRDMEIAALNKLNNLRERTHKKLQYALDNHQAVLLDVSINAPVIIAPFSADDASKMVLVIDLGAVKVQTCRGDPQTKPWQRGDVPSAVKQGLDEQVALRRNLQGTPLAPDDDSDISNSGDTVIEEDEGGSEQEDTSGGGGAGGGAAEPKAPREGKPSGPGPTRNGGAANGGKGTKGGRRGNGTDATDARLYDQYQLRVSQVQVMLGQYEQMQIVWQMARGAPPAANGASARRSAAGMSWRLGATAAVAGGFQAFGSNLQNLRSHGISADLGLHLVEPLTFALDISQSRLPADPTLARMCIKGKLPTIRLAHGQPSAQRRGERGPGRGGRVRGGRAAGQHV